MFHLGVTELYEALFCYSDVCSVSWSLTCLFVLLVSEMLTGWWQVSDIEQLRNLVDALHSRGFREKALQRQMQEFMEIIPEVCTKDTDGKHLSTSPRAQDHCIRLRFISRTEST